MATLPDHERALIPNSKLRYCLDPTHPTGRHKARVFQSALGLAASDAARLEQLLRTGIAGHDATLTCTFTDGTERWVVEWVVAGRLGPVRFVSAWDRRRGEPAPRLISCYLKKAKR